MKLDERGKQCPMPVIEAKKALESCPAGEIVEVIVDNEIAVQNLRKMADHKGLKSTWEKVNDREFVVGIEAGGQADGGSAAAGGSGQADGGSAAAGQGASASSGEDWEKELLSCAVDQGKPAPAGPAVVVLSSDQMGHGDEALGKLLMKGFVYALAQLEEPPHTVLLYNGGARLSCEGSESLEDLKELKERGTEIFTCGTCLNHYGLGDKLQVGEVTNMYEITQRLMEAGKIVKP